MMKESVKTLEHSAYGLSGATGVGTLGLDKLGLLAYLNENAGGIGVCLTFVFGITGILITIYANFRKDDRAKRNEKRIEELSVALKAIDERKKDKVK